jgi:hypothetical protein
VLRVVAVVHSDDLVSGCPGCRRSLWTPAVPARTFPRCVA